LLPVILTEVVKKQIMYMNYNTNIMKGLINMIPKNTVYNKIENHKIVSVYIMNGPVYACHL